VPGSFGLRSRRRLDHPRVYLDTLAFGAGDVTGQPGPVAIVTEARVWLDETVLEFAVQEYRLRRFVQDRGVPDAHRGCHDERYRTYPQASSHQAILLLRCLLMIVVVIVVGDAHLDLIVVFVIDQRVTPHEFAIYRCWLIAQNDVFCHCRSSGTGREHRRDQSGHQQEQERTPQVLSPSLWKGLRNPSSSGGFVPPETVTEKKDCVNGSLRRLLPLLT
jgi:hypothetical protein